MTDNPMHSSGTDTVSYPNALRAEQISCDLALFGSHERSLPLLNATYAEPADVFWPVFLENWNICDGLWPLRRILLSTLRQRKAEISPIAFLGPPDRAFYDALPGRVTVFRGCGRRCVRPAMDNRSRTRRIFRTWRPIYSPA
jgi:hypothetical protein